MKRAAWQIAVLLFVIAIGAESGCAPRRSEQAKNSVRIVAILPLSGPNAAIGKGMMNSVELAIREANEAKSLGNDTVIELVKYDDESKPEQAVLLATRATSDPKVLGIIAHYNSPCALAAVDIYHRAGVPTLIGGALATEITEKKYPEIFRVPANADSQGLYLAKYLIDIGRYKRIYILDDCSAWGKSIKKSLKKYLKERRANIVGEDSYHVGDKDFSALLTKVKALNPDALVVCGVSIEGGLIRTQMVSLKIPADFVGVSGVCTETFLATAGKAAEGAKAIYVLPPVEQLPGGQQFLRNYAKAGYKDPPEVVGILGYAAAQVLVEAMKRAQPQLTRQNILAQLRHGRFESAVGPATFDERGENKYYTFAFYVVRNGKWQVTHVVNSEGQIVPAAQRR